MFTESELLQMQADLQGQTDMLFCPHCKKDTTHLLHLLEPENPNGLQEWACIECNTKH